ncbi:MAG: DUF4838 domain-containing protein, partial [Armatimonadota bacterium]
MNFRGVLAIPVMLVVACMPVQAALTIVDGGKSDYEIVVAKNALPITVRAAQDLQEYVQKATGAKLEIVKADVPGAKPAIVVGEGPAAKSLGVNLDGIKAEGFRIKTVGKNLVIAGKDTPGSPDSDHWRSAPQAGTWNGVSRFLEKELNIRWFMPGKDGEYVPHADKLVVADQDCKDAPSMIYRRMTYLWTVNAPAARIKDVKGWERHNRAGWSIIWNATHSWIENFKAETYFKDHPEWFALVNGRRLAERPLAPQMCTTNAGALDEFARVAVAYGKKYPGVMFPLSPNDGGDFCECENCRALDRKFFSDGRPVLTDRIVTYASEVAKRVVKELPDQKFGLYSYSYFVDPPTYAKVHPSIYIMDVQNDINSLYKSRKSVSDHLNRRLLPWRKTMGDNLFFYSHPEGHGSGDLPCMHKGVLKDLFSNLNKANVKGYAMCNITSFAASGLNNYLTLQMAWDPSQDIDALYTDALNKCYGEKAAPFIRKYFDTVENRWGLFANKAVSSQDIAIGTVKSFPAAFDIVYNGLYEECMPLVKNAMAQTSDPGQQARIKLLADDLEFTRMTCELYGLSKKIIGNTNPQKEDVIRARNISKERIAMVNAGQYTNLFAEAKTGVFSIDEKFSLPLKPEVYDYILSQMSGGKAKVSASLAKTAPAIDGDLSDAAWQGAQVISVDKHNTDASQAGVETTARVVRDSANIYIGIECREPRMADIKDSITKRGGPVWNENDVEIFFDPLGSRKSYFQILSNSLGTIAEVKSNGIASGLWNSG